MLEFPDFSAVIFDLDGLVLDTEPTYFAAWGQALQSMGYGNAKALCQSWVGLAYSSIVRDLLDTYGEDFDLQRFEHLSSECWYGFVALDGIPIKPGFHAILAIIQQANIPYCLATNSMGVNARECLGLAGLADVFPAILSRDLVKHGKPDPDIYLKAAHCLNVTIDQCLVLEDSYPGVLAASRAGAMIAYIPSSAPEPQAADLANWQFTDLQQLAENIRIRFPQK